MKKMDFENLLKVADSAGLKKDYFSSEIYFYAWLYKSIIVNLIRELCPREFNITNSEYGFIPDSDKIDLVILLELYGSKKIKDVGQYIAANLQMIPTELRQRFNFLVGYNRGNDGGFVINEFGLKFISQDEFMADDTDGSLTDEIIDQAAYAANGKLKTLLA